MGLQSCRRRYGACFDLTKNRLGMLISVFRASLIESPSHLSAELKDRSLPPTGLCHEHYYTHTSIRM